MISSGLTQIASDGGDESTSRCRPMTKVIEAIWAGLGPVLARMKKYRWSTIDDHFHYGSSTNMNAPDNDTPFEVPCNAIFHRLNSSHVSRNVAMLRQLKVNVSESEMRRVNRVFGRSVRCLMTFLKKCAEVNVEELMHRINNLVVSGLEQRVGGFMDMNPPTLTSKGIRKLWSLLCPANGIMRFDEATSMVMNILKSHISLQAEEAKIIQASLSTADNAEDKKDLKEGTPSDSDGRDKKPVANPADADSGEESELDDEEEEDVYQSMSVRVLSRFVVDYIVESPWNDSRTSRSHNMSFSAFEAYVRQGHVRGIETKLKYLLQLEMGIAGPKAHVLVYVYLNKTKTKAVVLVEEPLKGELYSYEFEEDLSFLPDGATLRESFLKK